MESLSNILVVKTERGCFKVDPVTFETSVKGIFAGGDNASGPASVIDAVAAGKHAAESIGRYLNGEEMISDRFEHTLKPVPEELLPTTKNIEKKERARAIELPVENRTNNFNEIEAAFSVEEAIAEAERCLNCAQCSECMECVEACEKKAIDHNMKDQMIELEVGSVILTPGLKNLMQKAKVNMALIAIRMYLPVFSLNVCFQQQVLMAGIFCEGTMEKMPNG